MTHPKQTFCEKLEWSREIVWSGLTGMTRIDGDRLAKIELAATASLRTDYPGFRVTILNKREGEVDSTYFRFDEHLDCTLTGRTDGREDYPIPQNRTFQVIAHCGWDFYIAKPRTTRPFCEAVERHIEMFV
jgi:hypothetical protein